MHDGDVETCLKVLRTVRNECLGPHFFDADGAVILSHAHAKIVDLVKICEEEGNKSATDSEPTESAETTGDGDEDHHAYDPDLAV